MANAMEKFDFPIQRTNGTNYYKGYRRRNYIDPWLGGGYGIGRGISRVGGAAAGIKSISNIIKVSIPFKPKTVISKI